MTVSRTPQGNITIRRADKADVAQLLYICRRSFPDDILYQGVRWHAENWWQTAIMSEAADTYVLEHDNLVVAFAVLVKNEELWKKERKQRHGSFVTHLLSRLVCPMLAAAEIRIKIKDMMNTIKTRSRESPARKQYHQTWLELLAVLPEERRRGIATRLIQECESRTISMDREAIGLIVPKIELPAIQLYKKIGYEKVGRSLKYEFYLKLLDCTQAHEEASVPQD
jgi:ribosomal protein S18 acetylase RimI-like enzyme